MTTDLVVIDNETGSLVVMDDAALEFYRTRALDAIDSANLAESSRREYRRALLAYLETGGNPVDYDGLAAYAETCTASQRSKLSAAVKCYSKALDREARARATGENMLDTQAVLYRLSVLSEAVETKKTNGGQTHIWLSAAEVKALVATCDDSLSGRRDRVALSLLLGAGLRRDEAVNLEFGDVKYQPVKDKMRAVLAVKHGKGDKSRTVPISDKLASLLDAWAIDCGGQGRILRGFNRRGELTDSLSPVGLFNIVRQHGALIGHSELAPHDARRSYAMLGYEGGVSIVQIKELLGHASIATTQRYLNLALDLETTASDFVPL